MTGGLEAYSVIPRRPEADVGIRFLWCKVKVRGTDCHVASLLAMTVDVEA